MLKLSKYFKNDIVVSGQTLKPIIVIAKQKQAEFPYYLDGQYHNGKGEYVANPKFFLTSNNEYLEYTNALLNSGQISAYDNRKCDTISCIKNVSSIKVSNDYDKKTLKINTLRFTLYNHYDSNEKLSEYINDNLINHDVYLFYQSPSTYRLNLYPNEEAQEGDYDCALMYRGEISRVTTNDDIISITVEDKTQRQIAKKNVPYMSIDRLPENISSNISDEYKGKDAVVPMVFGKVDKSPVLPYVDSTNPRNLNLLFDFCPTSSTFKTSKVPSFFSGKNLPSGNPYYLYVKSGTDYLILDHFQGTTNFQSSKYSRSLLFLTGAGVPSDNLLPVVLGEEDETDFRLYDIVGFQQRMVKASYPVTGSIISLPNAQMSNLSNDDMLNAESISNNNGFEKRWYRAGEGVQSGDSSTNFNMNTTYHSQLTQKGDGRYIVLILEDGVSNELMNIHIDNVFAGNTFMLSDYKYSGTAAELGPSDNDGSFAQEGLGIFVAPLSADVLSAINQIADVLNFDAINSNEAIYAYQAYANALIAETSTQLDDIAQNPMEFQEFLCPINDFYENACIYALNSEAKGDKRYWGSSGGNNGLSYSSDYTGINGLYFGAKTPDNQDILVGESPDVHNNIILYEYFPPYWKDEQNGGASLSYISTLQMNNVAFLHSVKIEDIRSQKIYASIEGRKHHMFTEELDPELYIIGEDSSLIDNNLDFFTKNSDGSNPNLEYLVMYWASIMRTLLETSDALGTIPAASSILDGSVLGSEIDDIQNQSGQTKVWEANWGSMELGNYETTGQNYDQDGPASQFDGDGLPFSKIDTFLDSNQFNSLLEERWQDISSAVSAAVGDAPFATNYSLFRNFIYRICQMPVKLYHSFNFLYDTQGHNINLYEVFGREFFIKLILEYVFQTDINMNLAETDSYRNWKVSYWYRWKGGNTGDAWLAQEIFDIESKLSSVQEGYRNYDWQSWGTMTTLNEWIDNFYVYMDDLCTAYNKCLRELEEQIEPNLIDNEGSGRYWHFDGEYSQATENAQWAARGDGFDDWVQGNGWYYGISYYDSGIELSALREELLQIAQVSQEQQVDPVSTVTSGIIEKPSDIVMNILTTEMEYGKYHTTDTPDAIPSEDISQIGSDVLKPDYRYFDIEKIKQSRDAHDGWQMGFSINKKTDGKRLIENILKESKSYPAFTSEGKFTMITIKESYRDNDIDKMINLNDVLGYSFTQTKREDIITSLKVYYRYDNGQNKYGSSMQKSIQELLPSYQNTAYESYGLNETDSYREIELKYHADKNTVEDFVNYTLYNNCNPHNICELSLSLNNIDLSVGDIIHLPLINEEKVFNIDYSKLQTLNSQNIYPAWIIMEKDVGLDRVKIKAIQLHHLTSDELGDTAFNANTFGYPYQEVYGNKEQWSEYLFTGNQETSNLPIPYYNYDPNATIQYGPKIPYFDVSGDGVINVVDIVHTVNIILDPVGVSEQERKILTTYNSSGQQGTGNIDVTCIVSLVNIVLDLD